MCCSYDRSGGSYDGGLSRGKSNDSYYYYYYYYNYYDG